MAAQYNNNGYNRGGNPYAQQQSGYTQPAYNQPPYSQPQGYGNPPPAYGGSQFGGARPAMGRDDLHGENVEMEPLTGTAGGFDQRGDPNTVLNECRAIDQGIDSIQTNLEQVRMLQDRSLNDPDSSLSSSTNRKLDSMSSETMTLYREFAARIKRIKQMPESRSPKNAPQLGKVDRKLKKAINEYQQIESAYRRKMEDQMARQYRIVRPEASESEVRDAVADTSNQQVFSQALMQSDRRGQSQSALRNVENRHVAIQKIEQQMIELAQLFQDMDVMVVQQEESVTLIEAKGEEVQENLYKGNEQIGTAIGSARARNRKKWWCLLIVVIIIIIVVVIVVVYVVVNNNNKNKNKRSLDAIMGKIDARAVLPGFVGWSGDSRRALVERAWTG
ncbi:MAG: Plasma membrane t-SNARE, secretory vesicle fusion [Claussenomyces sp. TS43310]|nr:MAG: Plasma membrane t-SNARE, secretory vesicle fusion [Claussenomyces sp. TS43310]